MSPKTDFPPVRACLFDMDGLLLNTEDLYTAAVNIVLEKYNKPKLPWSVKARLQGRPGAAATALFEQWAQLPLSTEEYNQELTQHQRRLFPTTGPLPGVEKLLADLGRTRYWQEKRRAGEQGQTTDGEAPSRVHIALATSSHQGNFKLKTTHLTELFSVFESHRRVLGDDPRIPAGRGKPHPDIFLLALRTINESLPEGEPLIKPEECLVFEDSVPGVEAGRRAGMRVIWVPHVGLAAEYKGREGQVLAGMMGEAEDAESQIVGEVGDGWAELLPNLVDFPYERYGIVVPPVEVEKEECMNDTANGQLVV